MQKIKQIASSGVVHFVLLRYGTLVIQFANALVIAELLGAYYFGIYSFILLFFQYLSYSNLGTNHSLNVGLSTKKKSEEQRKAIWENLLWTNHAVTAALIVIFLPVFFVEIPYIEKYNFKDYAIPVVLTAIVINYNSLFVNLFRVFGKLGPINFFQILPPILTLAILPFLKGEELLDTWVWVNLCANVVAFFAFVFQSPFRFRAMRKPPLQKVLLQRGGHLLFYNMSFYFIMLSARTVISFWYSVEELGYFSFANSIASSVMLAGGAFAFIFFSKILNKLNSLSSEQAAAFLRKIHLVYVIPLNFLVLISMLFVPLVRLYLPEMSPSANSMLILLAGQMINNSNLGNTSYLIAKGKEGTLTVYGIQTILFVTLASCALGWASAGMELIAVVVVVGSFLYSYRVNLFVNKSLALKQQNSLKRYLSIIVSFLLIFASIYTDNFWLVVVSVVLYVLLERKTLVQAISEGIVLVTDKGKSRLD